MNIPRRTLSEIMVRYRLEPDLDDIYVEGIFDKKIIDKAFSELSVSRPIYDIDSVEIPEDILSKYGLTRGNKQEIIALCLELNLKENSKVTFFVDRDMDSHLAREVAYPRLVYTEHCDLEGIFLDEAGVQELICDAGKVKCEAWHILHKDIEYTVKAIFSVRLALEEQSYKSKLPPLSKSLKKYESTIVFDLNGFVRRCPSLPDSCDKILSKANCWLDRINEYDARNAGRGHDYFEVMEWAIKKFNGSKGIAESLSDLMILLAPRRAEKIVAPFSYRP